MDKTGRMSPVHHKITSSACPCCAKTSAPCCESPAMTFTKCCRNVQCAKNCTVDPPVSTAVLALLTGHWLDLDWMCVHGFKMMCDWFDSAFVAPSAHRPRTPAGFSKRESAHYSKRSRTSENAELIYSRRSVWRMEDARVPATGCLDL